MTGLRRKTGNHRSVPSPSGSWRIGAAPWAAGVCCLALLLTGLTRVANAQESISPLDDEGRLVQFDLHIAPILRNRCLECHGPDDAKNDFRVDDQYSMLGYVEPGEAEFSTLYSDYLTTDDEDLLMPPVSHGGPLSSMELALIRVWINEGADWPEDYEFVSAEVEEGDSAAEEVQAVPPPLSVSARVWAFQGYLHPATVHFPIALLLFGALFVVLGLKWPTIGTQIPMACLLMGAATAIVATLMGWSFATQQGYGGWAKVDMDSEVFWHRWSAVIVTLLATVLSVIAIVAVWRQRRGLHVVWKTGLLLVAVLVGLVGHQGGELTYGHDFYPKAFRILWGSPQQTPEVGEVSVDEVPGQPESDAS